jgi:glycosyltransferase involved in cell wall biosynthesis
VHILLDYRPALRQRTGAGEYAHHLAAALLGCLQPSDVLTLFSSSWKDRLPADTLPGARQVDARVPVRVLNLAWHRLGWPPVELLAGPVDVSQSMHPLLIPSRRGVRFITIHDLYFLDRTAGAPAEVRRDYAALVEAHARRADGIVVSSEHTRALIQTRLGVDPDRIVVCSPGAPDWPARQAPETAGPILFVGTIEPRKNIGGLLNAYARLLDRKAGTPPLILAGRPSPGAEPLLAPLAAPPLAGRVRALGYVSDAERLRLYHEASMLVLPSFDEGFGLPALEAMTVGVPVIVSRRGSLPEVVGEAGLLVEPDDHASLASAMAAVLDDRALATRLARAGQLRAAEYAWPAGAQRLVKAYAAAIERRRKQGT